MTSRNKTPTPNTGGGSRTHVARVQGLRSSGAAGRHLSRATRRGRTRSAERVRAIHRDRSAG